MSIFILKFTASSYSSITRFINDGGYIAQIVDESQVKSLII